jgi:CDP-paratose 2-epimerase
VSARTHALVTGGAGFIGTNLADRLLSDGRRVVVLDDLSRAGVEENLHWLESRHGSRLRVCIGDVRDRTTLRAVLRGADAVFHLAAQVAVTTSLDDPVADFDVNLRATVQLLEEVRALPRPVPFLFTSTNKVYGELPDVHLARDEDRWEPSDERLRRGGIAEDRPLAFCTPYGCSKGGADQYVLDHAKSFGFPAVVFRMSCIYGPHQHGNEDQGWIAHFLLRAAAGEPVTIFGDGAQVRDVLHVSDLVEAMVRVSASMEDGAASASAASEGSVFNVGGGARNTLSLRELLRLIEELDGRRPEVRHEPPRTGDQRWYVSDVTRLRHAVGWEPRVGVAHGVAALHAWLRRRTSAPVLAAPAARRPTHAPAL